MGVGGGGGQQDPGRRSVGHRSIHPVPEAHQVRVAGKLSRSGSWIVPALLQNPRPVG
ncbi:MAG: hypothetical protein WEA09_15330 [Gemmatimonadota bacterium]